MDDQTEPAPTVMNTVADDHIMQFFEFAHLPPHLASVSGEFYGLAHTMMSLLPRNPARTMMLRKLLEAKDAAVRCLLALTDD